MNTVSNSDRDGTDGAEEHSSEEDLDRRNFLQGVGAAGLATGSTLVAGCIGGSEDDNDSEDASGVNEGNDGGEASENHPVYYITQEQSPRFKEYWDKTAEQFEEQTGMKLNVDYGWDEGYNQRIAEQIQAGNAPDVINLEGFNVGQYITEDIMSDVSDIVGQFADDYGLPEQFRIKFDGGDRWFPFFAAATMHWFRKDQMEEEGWEGSGPAGTPANYEEYLDFMNTMDGVNDMNAGLIAAGETHWGTYFTWSHLWANGIQVAKMESEDQPTVALDDQRDKVADFLERYKELYDAGSPNTSNYSWTESIDSYANGQVHEALYGGSRHKIQAHERGREWAIDTEPAPTPKLDGEGQDYTFPSGWGVTDIGDNTEGGKKYVSMIMNDEDLLQEFYQQGPTHDIPVSNDMRQIDHPVWDVDVVNESYTDEQLQRVFDIFESGKPLFHETDPVNKWSSSMYMTFGLGRMMFEHLENDASTDDAIDTAVNLLNESLP